MKPRFTLSRGIFRSVAGGLGLAGALAAQEAPQFTGYQLLTSREMFLRLSASNGLNYRIDASTNLAQWNGFLTLLSTGQFQHTDSAAPFLASRYYRALQLTGTNIVTGDHLVTSNGDVVIHPVKHATLVLQWNGKAIYSDPTNQASLYAGLPRADLIFITHNHSDHYNASILSAVTNTGAIIVAPNAVFTSLPASLQARATVMTNGATTNLLGIGIEAIPMYNTNTSPPHTKGAGNGYVLTMGDRRIYISGDTHNIPEMYALRNIDVAFLAMNQPYTMTVPMAVHVTRAFRPKVVYPCHYRNSDGTLADVNSFKQQVGADLGIEVRLRPWY